MTIEGFRSDYTLHILVDGAPLSPAASQALLNHSPDGFECGYVGSGPAQLALAILLAAGTTANRAVALHTKFLWAFVQRWEAPFREEVDLDAWVAQQYSTTESIDTTGGTVLG